MTLTILIAVCGLLSCAALWLARAVQRARKLAERELAKAHRVTKQ